MECKVSSVVALISASSVLIETLWNVKVAVSMVIWPGMPVLIETLWNVKEEVQVDAEDETTY